MIKNIGLSLFLRVLGGRSLSMEDQVRRNRDYLFTSTIYALFCFNMVTFSLQGRALCNLSGQKRIFKLQPKHSE